jgi:hypothetical protein
VELVERLLASSKCQFDSGPLEIIQLGRISVVQITQESPVTDTYHAVQRDFSVYPSCYYRGAVTML